MSQFYAFNHGTFDDPALWSDGDLQQLCRKLGIPTEAGCRADMVRALADWHASRPGGAPSNWAAGNFTRLGVSVFKSSPTNPGVQRLAVSPRFLSPLTKRRQGRTGAVTCGSIRRKGERSTKKARFSPYNLVRVIPARGDDGDRYASAGRATAVAERLDFEGV